MGYSVCSTTPFGGPQHIMKNRVFMCTEHMSGENPPGLLYFNEAISTGSRLMKAPFLKGSRYSPFVVAPSG